MSYLIPLAILSVVAAAWDFGRRSLEDKKLAREFEKVVSAEAVKQLETLGTQLQELKRFLTERQTTVEDAQKAFMTQIRETVRYVETERRSAEAKTIQRVLPNGR